MVHWGWLVVTALVTGMLTLIVLCALMNNDD